MSSRPAKAGACGISWSARSREVNLDWKDYVEFDPRYLRPSEVDNLLGDASKAKKNLGWTARTSFEELVRIMVEADLKELKIEQKFVR